MDFKHSMSGGGPQAAPVPEEKSPLDQQAPITSRHTDQLNQHLLLTVQSVNRLQSIFTTRGA